MRASAGTGAFNIASAIVSALGDTFTAPILNTVRREMDYAMNSSAANLAPSPSQVLQLYYADRIEWPEARLMLSWHAIPYGNPNNYPGLPGRVRKWIDIVEINVPRLDTGTLISLWHQGIVNAAYVQQAVKNSGLFETDREAVARNTPAIPLADAISFRLQGLITPAQLAEATRRAGLADPFIVGLYQQQTAQLPMADVVNAHWLGTIPADEIDQQLNRAGFADPRLRQRLLELQQPFDPFTSVQLWWRGGLNELQRDAHLKANGYVDDAMRAAYVDGQRWMPGPADLISLAVREAWDDATAARFGYDLEFPEPLRHWMARQGADWTEPTPLVPGGAPVQVTWPKAYWRAHWQLMSPTQGYAALQRLRPERIGRYAGAIPGLRPFESADLQTLLKISDYPPEMRKWLQAISYNVLRLSDIRNGYLRAGKTKDWAVAQLQDRGYVIDDAKDVVEIWDQLWNYDQRRALRAIEMATDGQLVREIIAGYKDGYMERDDALRRLQRTGLNERTAQRQLDLADSQVARQTLREYVAAVKRDYLDGSISEVEVIARLREFRMSSVRITSLAQRWSSLRSTRRRALTTAQLLALMRQGVLDSGTVLRRLANLGWVQGDALVLLAGVQRTLSIQAQRLAQAQGKARAQQAKAVVAATKQARSLARQGQAELRRLYPKAELKRWLREGIASVPYVTTRLRQQGYPADYIEGFLKDAGYTKPKRPPAPKAGPPPSGPAAGAAPGGGGP